MALYDFKCSNCFFIEQDVLCRDPMDLMMTFPCPRCTIGDMCRCLSSPNIQVNGYSSKNNYSISKPPVDTQE